MSSVTTAHSVSEQFASAVNIIHNLPKEGSFQPSNEMKLKFYALYKQATIGDATGARPAFWDVVNRAKWYAAHVCARNCLRDAWNAMNAVPRETAMKSYVTSIKSIVETMPVSENVESFLATIGPMYEIVDPSGDTLHANGGIAKHVPAKTNGTVPNGKPRSNGQPTSNGNGIHHTPTTSSSTTRKANGILRHSADVSSARSDDDDEFADASDSLHDTSDEVIAELPADDHGPTVPTDDDVSVLSAPVVYVADDEKSPDDRAAPIAPLPTDMSSSMSTEMAALYEDAWQAVEAIRTRGVDAVRPDRDTQWSPFYYRRSARAVALEKAAGKARTSKKRESVDGERSTHDGGAAVTSSSTTAPATTSSALVRRDPTRTASSGSDSSSHTTLDDTHWDPHVASALFRMHRQLQQISTQLSLVETSLVTQQRLIAALVQQQQRSSSTMSSFWARLPWRTVAFIVAWPIIVNILGRFAYLRWLRRQRRC